MRFHTLPPSPGSSITTLDRARPGQTVELIRVASGRRLRKRLADLGLLTGQTVRVVQNHALGPLILAVHVDSRLAIGRGMARKITVRVLED